METDEVEEYRPHVELHSMRHADISNGSARPSRADGLHHRFLCADALRHRNAKSASVQRFNRSGCQLSISRQTAFSHFQHLETRYGDDAPIESSLRDWTSSIKPVSLQVRQTAIGSRLDL